VDEGASAATERLIESLESGDGGERRRALVIVNPYATTVSEHLRNLVVHALAGRYDVEAVETQAPGHATEICRAVAGDGYGLVVAFGGDGTVNEAANGLVGSPTPLTCLPGGSANVYCKLLGIPAEIVDATEHLLALADRFAPRQVDVGVVDGRHYTFCAGIGMDASVVRSVDANPRLKSRYGANYFLWTALATFTRRYLVRAPRLLVAVDGQTIAGVTAVVQNAEHYTYFHDHPIDLAAGATLDGGTLAGVVLRRGSLLDAPTLLIRAAAGRGLIVRHRQVTGFAGSSDLTVSSADGRPLPLQVDGDYLGDVTEAHFTIRARALAVVS
jgi:diacylglycerol kinase family enzyme